LGFNHIAVVEIEVKRLIAAQETRLNGLAVKPSLPTTTPSATNTAQAGSALGAGPSEQHAGSGNRGTDEDERHAQHHAEVAGHRPSIQRTTSALWNAA
jgi:hypothetical protein